MKGPSMADYTIPVVTPPTNSEGTKFGISMAVVGIIIGFLLGFMWGYGEGSAMRESEACRAGYARYNSFKKFEWLPNNQSSDKSN